MKYSFKIGSLWGIPIELHVTFILIILAVLGLAFYSSFASGNLSIFSAQFYTFFLVLFLFFFVVFHELAHSVVARHYGIKVRKIILYPIGGVSEIEEIPDKPSQEWRMAFAGPLTSIILGVALFGAALLYSPQTPILAGFTGLTGNFVFDLGIENILLGLFNLIPAFPMDGGRVFRALLAERMKFSDATRYAVYIGRILGIAMVIIGFIFPNYFLLILVGIFVYIGASEEGEQTIVSTALAGVRVKDVMQPEFGALDPQQSLTEALEVMFKNRYHDVLVLKDGVFKGVITWNELMKVQQEQRNAIKVEQMPLRLITVFTDESILEANKLMAREKIDLIPVMSKEDPTKVVGVLTGDALMKAYEKVRNR
jgi:Zn-dependent protease/predicted transcriptional regulator